MKSWHQHDEIYAVVMTIPAGRVATYGQVAEMAGLSRHARQVGYALRRLPVDSAVPWHRVVNARGAISLRSAAACESENESENEQRLLLEDEGVRFDGRGRIHLREFRWNP